jgi:putative inorganic carbon (hco3(-)) transporter
VILGAAAVLAAVPLFQAITGTWTQSLGGFGQVNAGYLRNPDMTPRASGPIGDPNYFAQILLPALAIALVAFRSRARHARRWPVFALAGLVATGVLLTYSRGAVLAFVLVVVALVALGYAKASHVLLIAAVVIGLVLAVPQYGERVLSISSIAGATADEGSGEEADVATRGRAGEMLAAVHVFADHPVVGVGPGIFPLHYQEYAKRLGMDIHSTARVETRAGEEPPRQAHSFVLATAADLGLVGLALYAGLFITLLHALLRAHRRRRLDDPALSDLAAALFLALTAYLAAGLFLSLAFERYLWLLVALAGAAVRLAVHESMKSASRAS